MVTVGVVHAQHSTKDIVQSGEPNGHDLVSGGEVAQT